MGDSVGDPRDGTDEDVGDFFFTLSSKHTNPLPQYLLLVSFESGSDDSDLIPPQTIQPYSRTQMKALPLLLLFLHPAPLASFSAMSPSPQAAASGAASPPPSLELIPEATWRDAAAKHRERVRRLVGGSLGGGDPKSSSSGGGTTTNNALDRTNPIYNFLFNYYFWKPAQIAQYSPGARKVLLGAAFHEMPKSGSQRRALPFSSSSSSSSSSSFCLFFVLCTQ